MASEVTTVTIGDYQYTLYDDQTAAALARDRTKSSYGALQSSVTHEGVTYALTSLSYCFLDCTALTTAPVIPSGVTNMFACFQSTALTTAPSIPSSVTNMQACFAFCTALTTAPSIPNGVTNVSFCFEGCTALTGTIAVHGTPTSYSSCFRDTTQPIVLVVSDSSEVPTWKQVAATGNNGNVTVRDVSANPAPTATITATRVASRGSTTPDETGRYAYVTVRTTASTEQAPDNVAQAPTITLDGTTYTPLDPSGTATFACWVALGDDFGHVIGATPRDLYKTGTTVTVTLPSTYSPMEFHRTGDGASFGKHATRAGLLDVAWDIESDGDVSADGDVADGIGTLDEVRQQLLAYENLPIEYGPNVQTVGYKQGHVVGKLLFFAISCKPKTTDGVIATFPSHSVQRAYGLVGHQSNGNTGIAEPDYATGGLRLRCTKVDWCVVVGWGFIA